MCKEHSRYLTQGLFNNEALIFLHDESEKQNGRQQGAARRQDLVADQALTLRATTRHQRASYTHVGQEKHPNPGFEVWFLMNIYCFQAQNNRYEKGKYQTKEIKLLR